MGANERGHACMQRKGHARPSSVLAMMASLPLACICAQVPRDHEEIIRLEGRYKNQGGLMEGMVVELANGASAVVAKVSEAAVCIDVNNMMAGKTRTFEVKLLDIEPAQR